MASQYTRPLPRSWWLQKANYFIFMARELTSVAVFAYALFLVVLMWRAIDNASFSAFYDGLQSPWSVVVHLIVLVLALFHTGTWIALTPKVLVLWKDDDRVEPDLIAGVNGIAWLAVSGLVLWLVLS
jgi:fumarate reductase subunit C